MISNTISPLCSLSSLFWAPVKPDEQAPRRTKANARTGPAAVRPRSLLVRVSDFRLCREHRASVGDNLGTFIFKGVRKKRHSGRQPFCGRAERLRVATRAPATVRAAGRGTPAEPAMMPMQMDPAASRAVAGPLPVAQAPAQRRDAEKEVAQALEIIPGRLFHYVAKWQPTETEEAHFFSVSRPPPALRSALASSPPPVRLAVRHCTA